MAASPAEPVLPFLAGPPPEPRAEARELNVADWTFQAADRRTPGQARGGRIGVPA